MITRMIKNQTQAKLKEKKINNFLELNFNSHLWTTSKLVLKSIAYKIVPLALRSFQQP